MGLPSVALYVHSLNPRGGVVHALSVGEALLARGHRVTLVAPAERGGGLFRATPVELTLFEAATVRGSLEELVRRRIPEYQACVRERLPGFEVHHAHDGMSGAAVAELRAEGVVPAYVRTVHHLDEFGDGYLGRTQAASVAGADRVLCVSRLWAGRLREEWGLEAAVVGNGVDRGRFSSACEAEDRERCEALAGPLRGPVLLCVGGVERRKNTVRAVRAFLRVRGDLPAETSLVVVGGATLLDHSSEQRALRDVLAAAGPEAAGAVRVTGPVPDEVMPSFYRTAVALLFPSLVEGFGLAVLEAMSCGTAVVTSRRAPFTEYLEEEDAFWVDPEDETAIAGGIVAAFDAEARTARVERGLAVAERCSWASTAAACARAYQEVCKEVVG